MSRSYINDWHPVTSQFGLNRANAAQRSDEVAASLLDSKMIDKSITDLRLGEEAAAVARRKDWAPITEAVEQLGVISAVTAQDPTAVAEAYADAITAAPEASRGDIMKAVAIDLSDKIKSGEIAPKVADDVISRVAALMSGSDVLPAGAILSPLGLDADLAGGKVYYDNKEVGTIVSTRVGRSLIYDIEVTNPDGSKSVEKLNQKEFNSIFAGSVISKPIDKWEAYVKLVEKLNPAGAALANTAAGLSRHATDSARTIAEAKAMTDLFLNDKAHGGAADIFTFTPLPAVAKTGRSPALPKIAEYSIEYTDNTSAKKKGFALPDGANMVITLDGKTAGRIPREAFAALVTEGKALFDPAAVVAPEYIKSAMYSFLNPAVKAKRGFSKGARSTAVKSVYEKMLTTAGYDLTAVKGDDVMFPVYNEFFAGAPKMPLVGKGLRSDSSKVQKKLFNAISQQLDEMESRGEISPEKRDTIIKRIMELMRI